MYKKLKQAISALAVTAVLTGSLVAPRTSHATVGIVTALFGGAGVPVMVVGGALGAVGVILLECPTSDWQGVFVDTLGGLGLAFAGLVVLDEKDHQGVSFSALDEMSAVSLGVSRLEMQAYNNELDEVNAIRDEVTARLLESGKPTFEMSQAAWSELKAEVSPEAFGVVQKISGRMVHNIQVARDSK